MSAIRTPHPPVRRLSIGAAAGIPLALAAGVLIAGPARADVVGSVRYDVPGTYTWTVPAGTDSAVFDVFGGAGGGMSFTGRPGPQGGHVRATLAVTAGETFTVVVGGRGGDGDGPGPGLRGYNGGAPAGILISKNSDIFGGGGGGASDVRRGGTDLTDRILVAGGGGGLGAAAAVGGTPAGAGGADIGQDGGDATPATGGTQSAGGTGAVPVAPGRPGSAGSLGAGGTGGVSPNLLLQTWNSGGGGGGGWYGGGGGGGSTGAGGSNYQPFAGAAAAGLSERGGNAGDGRIVIDYGASRFPLFGTPIATQFQAGQPVDERVSAVGWPTPQFATVSPLPPGLSLTPDGVLSGTPTSPGTYPVTVYAQNTAGTSIEQMTLSVGCGLPRTITASGPMLTAAGSAFPEHLTATATDYCGNAVPNIPLTFDLPTTGPSASFADGSRQATVATDASGVADAGVITANDTAGDYDAHAAFAAYYANGESPVVSVPLTNTDSVPTFPAVTPPTATVGVPYSFRFPTTGTPTPTVVLLGTLPAGLTLAPDGTVSGTPTTAVSQTFMLQAINPVGQPAQEETLTVLPGLAMPRLAITGASVREGNTGTTQLRFPVTLSQASSTAVTVRWATVGGTATAGTDYIRGSGTLTFAPGARQATVIVVVRGDRVRERNETVIVRLTSPSGATSATAQATGTIRNDD